MAGGSKRSTASKPRRQAVAGGRRQRRSPGQWLRVYVSRHLQNFFGSLGRLWRHAFSSLMTIAVIGIALALPASLQILVQNGKAISGSWESVVDLTVYLDKAVTESQLKTLASDIESRVDVADVEVIPADAALAEFREYSGFGAALDALTENPLPHVLVVRPADTHSDAASIESLRGNLDAMRESAMVQIDTEWVTRFHAILDTVRRAVHLAALLLGIGVLIIVGNTIRLDIQNRRSEIEVMKLIGGSDAFIRRPFLYGGFWYGLGGGLIALALVQLGLALLAGPVRHLAGLYGSEFALMGLGGTSNLLLPAIGMLLGWLGSWIAASRHLKTIEPNI
jgi:cell division transport system permease protein